MGFHPWGVGVNLTNDFDFYDYKMLRFKNRLSVCLYIASAFTFSVSCVSAVFFFFLAALVDFLSVNSAFVHCSWTHKLHFLAIFSLKMCPTVLFTHLKIILLQYFQFSIFSFSKISSIQTHPISFNHNTRHQVENELD